MSCNGPRGVDGTIKPQTHARIAPILNTPSTMGYSEASAVEDKPVAHIEIEGVKHALAGIYREAEGWSKKDAQFKRGTLRLRDRMEALLPNTAAVLILNNGEHWKINLPYGLSGKPKIPVPFDVTYANETVTQRMRRSLQ